MTIRFQPDVPRFWISLRNAIPDMRQDEIDNNK
jgi:hypothetical protein